MGGEVNLYVRTTVAGSNLPSTVPLLTNWTLSPTNGNWSPTRIDTLSTMPVVDYDREDFILNEIVRSGNEIFIVNDVTLANDAMDVTNSNSGFFRVGNFDNTHSMFFNGQNLSSAPFEVEEG